VITVAVGKSFEQSPPRIRVDCTGVAVDVGVVDGVALGAGEELGAELGAAFGDPVAAVHPASALMAVTAIAVSSTGRVSRGSRTILREIMRQSYGSTRFGSSYLRCRLHHGLVTARRAKLAVATDGSQQQQQQRSQKLRGHRVRALITRLLADERVRFLIVGGINTVVGYAIFAVLQLTVGHRIGGAAGYLLSLYGSYVLAIGLAFVLHRRFTFKVVSSGSKVLEFLRFSSVYVVSLAINTALLPALVELAGIPPLVAQALSVIVTTLVSYFGHRFFSFRKSRQRPASIPPAAIPPA
jgi:putative flippase GtrA